MAKRRMVKDLTYGQMMDRGGFVMCLNDHETYTGLNGCRVVYVPEDVEFDDIERGLKDGDPRFKVVLTSEDIHRTLCRRYNRVRKTSR